MKTSKMQAFLGKHWTVIGGGFLILLIAASSFGVVLDHRSRSGDGAGNGDPNAANGGTANPAKKGTQVGAYNGINIYKISDIDHYANLNGVEWHFRGNPAEAANVTLESRYKLILGTVRGGPGTRDILTGKKFDKIVFLTDPTGNARVGLDVLEVSKALGSLGWSYQNLENAFTSDVESQPGAKVMTLSQAQETNETALILYFGVSPDLPTPSAIRAYYTDGSKGAAIFVLGRDYASLDRAETTIAMFLLGWLQ